MNNGRIFDSANADSENSKLLSTSEFKNKPDGWETTSKAPDGNVWEMSQREEDILLQEFDRRIAYCKFQVGVVTYEHFCHQVLWSSNPNVIAANLNACF